MNYQRLYNTIIKNAKSRCQPKTDYFEIHHVIPRCMGGTDDADNLAKLTAKEHFICHLLLVKIYQKTEHFHKLLHAFMCMLWWHNNETQNRYRVTSTIYEKLRKKFSEKQSKNLRGEKNGTYGSFWMTDPKTGQSEKVKVVVDGWLRGRNVKKCNCKSCGIETVVSRTIEDSKVKCRVCIDAWKNRPKKPPCVKNPIPRKLLPVLSVKCAICDNIFLSKGVKTCSPECAKIYSKKKTLEKITIAIIDDIGNKFSSLTEASKFHNVSVEMIRLRVKSGKYKKIENIGV